MENCNNCAWYCHSDGKCYKPVTRSDGTASAVKVITGNCPDWTFDGLKEWEREQMLLMTMEYKAS